MSTKISANRHASKEGETKMQARETQLLTLLAGQHQFVIPIFQRDYSWGGDECKRLVDHVLEVADGPDGAIHFLGSVVWVGSGAGDAVLQQRLVIDGQPGRFLCADASGI